MDSASEEGDKDLYYQLNLEFHALVIALAHSERTARLYDGFVKELYLFRRQNFDNTGNMRKSNSEHRRIYEAIAWSNEEFLAALADPKDPEHENMKEWIGGDFDPAAFDVDEVNRRLSPSEY